MTESSVKIQIAASQRYSCICCGRCCHRFRVLLRPGEISQLEALPWGEDKPWDGKFYDNFSGYPYFKRQPNGSCIFQNEDGRCEMHKRFGFDKKALTCRGYPLNYVSTWPGEISVLARMDCPAVLKNHGDLLTQHGEEIQKLAGELRFGGGFTEEQLQGLQRKTVEKICEILRELLQASPLSPALLALQLMNFIQHLEKLGAVFLNDETVLKEVLPSLKEKSAKEAKQLSRKGLSAFSRCMFRQLLSAYCLRDEEMLDTGVRSRLSKAWQVAKGIFGGGNWRAFGEEHPDFPVRKSKFFRGEGGDEGDSVAWESWRRFVSVRLECFQFFGFAYYQQAFFPGLKALLLTFPVALAQARVHAASCNRTEVLGEDVEYAVSSVDHCHGRSPRLKFKFSRQSEDYFFGTRFGKLIRCLGIHLDG